MGRGYVFVPWVASEEAVVLRVVGDFLAAPLSGAVTMEETSIMALVSRFIHQDSGQDLIEYALLAAFISVAAVAAISTIGTALNTSYTNINAQIVAAP